MKKVAKPRTQAKKKEPQPLRDRPATLVDVARSAGVVPMTASRAINGTGYVSEQVRERVLRVAKKLDYRPNVLARSLKQQRLNTVGVMLPDIANPFSAELVAGIQEVLAEAGYSAFLATAGRSVEKERDSLLAFVDHRLDGIIVATRGTEIGNEIVNEITKQNIPVVTVGHPIEGSAVDCVTADHQKGTYAATTHLIELGHKNIGFIGVAMEDALNLRRFRGYLAALTEHGLTLHKEYVVGPSHGPAYSTEEDGYKGMLSLVKLKRRPSAIVARNDFTAIGVLRAAHELGLAVPDEIAVVGFDNIPLSNFAIPPLTTVAQPIVEQGRRAARFLIDRIERTYEGSRREVCLDCQLIVRESTTAARYQKASVTK
jgi:DNA-binding LacI/PurR family transcriptional regulator